MTIRITNFHRAGWAKNALTTFIDETGNDAAVDRLSKNDLSDAVADLICGLLHFANQSSLSAEGIAAQAQANYEAELVEE